MLKESSIRLVLKSWKTRKVMASNPAQLLSVECSNTFITIIAQTSSEQLFPQIDPLPGNLALHINQHTATAAAVVINRSFLLGLLNRLFSSNPSIQLIPYKFLTWYFPNMVFFFFDFNNCCFCWISFGFFPGYCLQSFFTFSVLL